MLQGCENWFQLGTMQRGLGHGPIWTYVSLHVRVCVVGAGLNITIEPSHSAQCIFNTYSCNRNFNSLRPSSENCISMEQKRDVISPVVSKSSFFLCQRTQKLHSLGNQEKESALRKIPDWHSRLHVLGTKGGGRKEGAPSTQSRASRHSPCGNCGPPSWPEKEPPENGIRGQNSCSLAQVKFGSLFLIEQDKNNA